MAEDLIDNLVRDDDETTTSRRTDPELLILGRIIRELDAVDLDARRRIVAFLADRFNYREY